MAIATERAAAHDLSALTERTVARRLVDVLNLAIERERLQDAEVLLATLRALRPGIAQFDCFEAWLALKRGFRPDAVRLLRSLDANIDWPLGKAMLAYALFVSGDASWRISANEVLASDAPADARNLVRLMLNPEEANEEPADEDAQAHDSVPQPLMDVGAERFLRA